MIQIKLIGLEIMGWLTDKEGIKGTRRELKAQGVVIYCHFGLIMAHMTHQNIKFEKHAVCLDMSLFEIITVTLFIMWCMWDKKLIGKIKKW